MQRPDEKKRKDILDASVKLFASRPYHEVRLEDVAAAAKVGKGTLYVYFKGKDELFYGLIEEGLTQLLDRLDQQVGNHSGAAWDLVRSIVGEFVAFAKRYPHMYELLRGGTIMDRDREALRDKRQRMAKLVESAIRLGVKRGELTDPNPGLTAQFIPSMVRAATVFGPKDMAREEVTEHILRVLGQGLLKKRGGK